MIIVNGKKVDITKFPNNEILLKAEYNIGRINYIRFKFESNEDFITLMFLKKHIDSVSFKSINTLHISYLPYSRMDRTEGQTIFTLKYICEFINSMNFDEVHIDEPHSEVSMALLDRVYSHNMTSEIAKEVIRELKFTNNNDYIFYPDQGAIKRYGKQIKYPRTLSASKERDFETGYIKSLTLDKIPTEPFRVIIVDDLCSKGGTFMLSANKLKEVGATEIYLIVTHCENTILDGDVLKDNSPIDKVYTTNSILNTSVVNSKLEIR